MAHPAAFSMFFGFAIAISVNNKLGHLPTEANEQLAEAVMHISQDVAEAHFTRWHFPEIAVDVVSDEERIGALETGIDDFGVSPGIH